MRSRLAIRATLFAFVVALAACSSLIPPYERPAAPVPPTYPPDVTPASASARAAADVDWQRFFADRAWKADRLALANNRDLRIAVLNIEQARAIYQIRRADELPSVGIGASASRAAVGNGVATVYAVGFALSSYELDLFGRVRDLSDAALAQYFATAESRKAVQISLVSSVANAYLTLLADEDQLRVTRDTLVTREESTRITKLRFDNGATSELDYRQAESQLEGAKAALALALRQRALDENALQLLVGQPLPADLPPPLALGAEQIPADVPPGLPSELLERRPDIRAAERQLLAANANIGAARGVLSASRSPISVPQAATSGAIPGRLVRVHRNSAAAAADLRRQPQPGQPRRGTGQPASPWPSTALDQARSARSRALADRATLGEQRAQAAQTNALAIMYRLADLRYRAGAASYLEALDAQLRSSSQLSLVQTQALQLQNMVVLYRALGGGWHESAEVSAASNPTIPPP